MTTRLEDHEDSKPRGRSVNVDGPPSRYPRKLSKRFTSNAYASAISAWLDRINSDWDPARYMRRRFANQT